MKLRLISSVAILCLASTPVYAGITDGWSGEASLTGSNTTGNTDTTDVGLGLKLKKDGDVWRHKFKALVDYGEVDGAQNRQRFSLGYQIDRDVNERLYLYGNADYYNDDFGAFQQGYFIGGGAGYKVILPEPVGWNLEGGVGFRSQESQGPTPPALLPLSVTDNEVALRGFSDFDYKFNDNVAFYNDTEIIWSSSDTYIWNEVGITATLAGNLAARASFRVDHHTDAPIGTENTDTVTRFGIVYTMK